MWQPLINQRRGSATLQSRTTSSLIDLGQSIPLSRGKPCPDLVLRYHSQLRAGAGGTGNDDCESAMRGVMVQKGRPSDAHLSTVTLGLLPSHPPSAENDICTAVSSASWICLSSLNNSPWHGRTQIMNVRNWNAASNPVGPSGVSRRGRRSAFTPSLSTNPGMRNVITRPAPYN